MGIFDFITHRNAPPGREDDPQYRIDAGHVNKLQTAILALNDDKVSQAVADTRYLPAEIDGTPAATIPAAEWTATRGQASRAATQRYDVRAYGSVGTANDAATFQAAIDAAFAAGGGTVTGPAGAYVFTSGLTLKNGVYLDFPGSGNTTLDFSAASVPASGSLLAATGTLAALPALAASVALHATTVTFASAPALAPRDVFCLYDSADYSFHPSRSYYRAGEWCRVKSVAGNVVTLEAPTFAAYASGGTVSAHKMLPVRTGIRGVSLIGKLGSRLSDVTLGTDLVIDDVTATGSDYALFNLSRCYNVSISGVRGTQYVLGGTNTDYGVVLGNCQRVRLHDVDLITGRHGFATGGGNVTGAVPNRDITITDSTIGSVTAMHGLDTHGNTEHVLIDTCTLPNAAAFAGDHITLRGSTVRSGLMTEPVYTGEEMLGPNLTIEDCDIHAQRNHSGLRAFVYLQLRSAATRAGTLRVAGNRLHLGGYVAASASTNGLLVYNVDSPASGINVEIEGNTIHSTASATAHRDITVWCASGKAFERVTIAGNTLARGQIRGIDLNCRVLIVRHNTSIGGNEVGMFIDENPAPVYPTPRWIVEHNTVLESASYGARLSGQATGTLIFRDNTILRANAAGSADALAGAGVVLDQWGTAIVADNTVGDDRAVPLQARRWYVATITTLDEADNRTLGTVTADTVTAITTRRFQGRGAGAPAFVAADGSVYFDITPGAAKAMYVRQAGAWV